MLAQAEEGCRSGDRPGHHRGATRHAPSRREGPGPSRRNRRQGLLARRARGCARSRRSEIERGIHALERKEFVRRERRSSVAGETAYVFRHVLVRDVAYGQIPRKRRADMHRLAAGWIEALAGDRPEDLADMVAHHYLSALELARASRRPEETLSSVPAGASRRGRPLGRIERFAAAARFYGEALELWPEDDGGYAQLLSVRPGALLPGTRKGEPARGRRRIPRLGDARAHRKP